MLNTQMQDATVTPPDSDRLSDLLISQELVTVTWADGAESAFHGIWLRDNCPTGLHPSTR